MKTPFITLLAILQQSEYEFPVLQKWYLVHRDDQTIIEPEKWTTKLKLIQSISSSLFFFPPLTRIQGALLLLAPFDFSARALIFSAAFLKMRWLQLHGLKIVAIAGSYGKTSTKHILQHTLGKHIPLLMTPESVNTALGISQVVFKQLSTKHKLFIVELGEFHHNHIQQLCTFVRPNFGIVTPLGRQHVERLGNLRNIAMTMFALPKFLHFNAHKTIVSESYQPYFSDLPMYYGTTKKSQYRIEDAQVTRSGTEFSVFLNGEKIPKLFLPLFGEHQAVNALPSFWLAQQLGMTSIQVAKALRTMPPISRRHEPMFAANNVLILDNSYNTNPDSIQESLKLLMQLDADRRMIVTLGFIELGKESNKIHRELGKQLVHTVDYAGVITSPSSNDIRQGFLEGGGNKEHFVLGKDQADVIQKLQRFIIPNTVILLEGGYRELYS